MIVTDYNEVYRGPCKFSKPDNSTIDMQKKITGLGWSPFTAGQEEMDKDPLLVEFIAANANNILPYQE